MAIRIPEKVFVLKWLNPVLTDSVPRRPGGDRKCRYDTMSDEDIVWGLGLG
jgi:hypothetical protein